MSQHAHNVMDSSLKSHNALGKYPTVRHFVTDICTHMHLRNWSIVGNGQVHRGICEIGLLYQVENYVRVMCLSSQQPEMEWLSWIMHTLCALLYFHDDVIKWKHFPCYWPFVRGIHRSPVNSPHKGQWRGAKMVSLICARINGWVNHREAGDKRRHRAHYDVTVMSLWFGTVECYP